VEVELQVEDGSWRFSFNAKIPNLKRYKIELKLIEIDRILEHEKVLPNKLLMDQLVNSIKNHGFLHPPLLTQLKKFYVIADGTHRIHALRRIKKEEGLTSLYCLGTVLHPNQFERRVWAMIYTRGIKNLDKIRKTWSNSLIEVKNENDVINILKNCTVAGLICKNGRVYKIEVAALPRKYFLETVKKIEETLETPDEYTLVEEAISSNYDWAILAPPIDEYRDIEILVNNEELRRAKGSKTTVPLRVMYLPIKLETLKSDLEKAKSDVVEKIETCFENNLVIVLPPGARSLDFCGERWDHYLIILDSDFMFKTVSPEVKKKLQNILIPITHVKA